MRFCVDEAVAGFPSETAARSRRLEELGLLVERCHDQGHLVERLSGLLEASLAPGLALWQLLYEETWGLDREVRQLVSVALDRCVAWDHHTPLPEPADIVLNGDNLVARSIFRAHLLAIDREAVGLIELGEARRGRQPVGRADVIREIHFLVSDPDRLPFDRDVPEVEEQDAEKYLAHAPLAFPAIHFVTGLAAQARRFSRPFNELRPTVTLHLAALNDWFPARSAPSWAPLSAGGVLARDLANSASRIAARKLARGATALRTVHQCRRKSIIIKRLHC